MADGEQLSELGLAREAFTARQSVLDRRIGSISLAMDTGYEQQSDRDTALFIIDGSAEITLAGEEARLLNPGDEIQIDGMHSYKIQAGGQSLHFLHACSLKPQQVKT